MLDTNLKSNRKIRTIITIVILSLFAVGVVESYYVVRKDIASTFTVEDDVEECIERMDYSLAIGNRLLYSEVTDAMDASEQMELMSDSAFSLFKKYMDYQIFDKEGNPLLEGNDDQTNEALKSDNSYVLKIEYKYGTSGTMSNVTVSGTKLSPEEAYDVEKDLSYYCMDADLEDQIDDEEQTNGISIVYGMTDANYDALLKAERVNNTILTDADSFVSRNLSYILHGNYDFYTNLKRIKNRTLAQLKAFKGIPYFIEGTNGIVNQFCMSAGENMLISLLHMLNVVIVRPAKSEDVRLILIDEIELALHPSAIMRLVDFLQKLATEYNLAIYFSSHSIELLRKIKPSNIFHLQKELDNIAIVNPCYPSYATRDIYQHSGYDFLILVEDVLAKYILENIIDENALYKSKLINILPSGGWENVLKMQDDICKSNLAGVGTKVLSVLDGDVKPDFEQLYKQKGLYTNLTINFLPIHSLEKYLHEKIIVNKDADFFKEIGDRFFKVKSLKEVVDSLIKKNDDKAFYNYIIKSLKEQGIEENVFVQKVCEMIYRKEDMSKLLTFLQKTFQN
mgnify:CR=1 FL=1